MENHARVTLAQPSDSLCYTWKARATKRMPLGLGYIAAALAKEEHDVRIVDGSLHNLTVEETARQALENDPHVVGITCTTPLYHQAVAVIALIKKLSPRTTVVVGGPHVSALPRPTLETSETDFVCIGEGEESMPAIVQCILGKKDPGGIIGIAYNWKEYQGQNQTYRLRISEKKDAHAPAIDLNKVPTPARELFEFQKYVDYSRDSFGPQTGAMFSRGCPGKCAFCGAADTLVRWRDISNVLDELAYIQNSLGIQNVFVMDDTYTSNRKRVLSLSRGIVERGIRLNLSVQLRLDQIDEEICDALYQSGIRHVGPGIESGNELIIKAIGKGPRESKDAMRRKIRLLQNYAWKIRCSYVFGMVGETEEQILETIEFAKELGADENAFSILVPYPDSPLWAYAKRKGAVHDRMDFSKFLYYHTIGCNLSNVSTERLLELHEFAYEYVGNPAYHVDDDSVSSGNRPHIPYLTSEAFRKHREESRRNLDSQLRDSHDAAERAFEEKRSGANARESFERYVAASDSRNRENTLVE